MGAFVVVIVALLMAVWLVIAPYGQDAQQSNTNPTQAGVQAIAANMIRFHQAAVDFVSLTANKAPTSTRWGFTYLNQAAVRCSPYASAAYPTNSVSGTCAAPATAFSMPSFMSDTVAAYDWVVCYQTGSPNIVVTYSRSGENPGGHTPAEISAALADYSISSNYTNWYWGVTTAGPAVNLPSALTLPVTCTTSPASAVPVGAIAIATVVP